MAQAFASERGATINPYGFCDRCGFRYDLIELKDEVVNGVNSNARVCPECFDIDHPQNFLGRFYINDPQALMDARPDVTLDESRRLYGFNPVGQVTTSTAFARIGKVTVVTT